MINFLLAYLNKEKNNLLFFIFPFVDDGLVIPIFEFAPGLKKEFDVSSEDGFPGDGVEVLDDEENLV